jgi:hypothetical protein
MKPYFPRWETWLALGRSPLTHLAMDSWVDTAPKRNFMGVLTEGVNLP